MALTDRDVEALENALLAIDTSVRTLMMARQIIEDRLPGGLMSEGDTGQVTMGGEPADCEHLLTRDITTMGRTVSVCKNPECAAVLS